MSDAYAKDRAGFGWRVPARFNIAQAVVDRHDPDALALIQVAADGNTRDWRFGEIARASARLAHVLKAHGLRPGDRLAILLPQAPETAIAHIAAYRSGLVAVPLFTLFGPDALAYRLSDSGARAVITDPEGWIKLQSIRDQLPADLVALVVGQGAHGDGAHGDGFLDFDLACAQASDDFPALDTAADDPAVIIYTSGTTGSPKGALHAHRVLLGHLPGVEWPHDRFPQPGDRFWTPADWAWIGGLLDVLLPSWFHGIPVIAHRMAKFEPDRAADLIRRHGARNLFMPPTALKLMRDAPGALLPVRSVASGGEPLGEALLDWGRARFGKTINEFYGQTECNLVVGQSGGWRMKPGSMGRPIPGHEVAVVDAEGRVVSPDAVGTIAVRRPDPVMFLGYWNRPEATAEKFIGDWMLTGDQGRMDSDGFLWFVGRDDDVITSSGYRIGPGELEECLLRHPSVALAAVVGLPDALRTEKVTAFVVLRAGFEATNSLASELQAFMKARVAAHAYPREIRFRESLPMTTTGKIMRRVLRDEG